MYTSRRIMKRHAALRKALWMTLYTACCTAVTLVKHWTTKYAILEKGSIFLIAHRLFTYTSPAQQCFTFTTDRTDGL